LVASFGARSRITPTIISESTISGYRDIVVGKTLPATNQHCIKTSAAIIALAIDELLVTISANRRGNLTTSEDGFTYDLEHLAYFCVVAKLFDFDIKIIDTCLRRVSQKKRGLAAIQYPPASDSDSEVQCHGASAGSWFRSDSRKLCKAIVQYLYDVSLPHAYLFRFLE
jgi:hypothetical protein